MSDCYWCMVDACPAMSCINCKKYLSVNTDEGSLKLETYEGKIADALKPLMDGNKEEFAKL